MSLSHESVAPQAFLRLVEREVELDKPMQQFREMVEKMRAYPDEPMIIEEIQAEVEQSGPIAAAGEGSR